MTELRKQLQELVRIMTLAKATKILGVDRLTLRNILEWRNATQRTLIRIRSNLDSFVCDLSDLNVTISDTVDLLIKK
jgi:hypothetical protein